MAEAAVAAEEERGKLVQEEQEAEYDEGKYCLNVTLCVKAERREEFLQCIRANCAGTLSTEPLALLYQWGENVDEPNTFHFQEAYVGKAGFEAHTKTAHFGAWEKFASSDPFSRAPQVTFFNAVAVHVPKDCEFM